MASYNPNVDWGEMLKNAKTEEERRIYAENRQKKETDMRANGTWNSAWQSTDQMYTPAPDPMARYYENMEAVNQAKTEQAVDRLMGQIPGLNREYDRLQKDSYLNYRLGQKNMPEQMARMGLGGSGVSETTLAGQQSNYENAVNGAELSRKNAVQGINNEAQNARATGDLASAQTRADYYLQKAQQDRAEAQLRQEDARYEREWDYRTEDRDYQRNQEAKRLAAEEEARKNSYRYASSGGSRGDYSPKEEKPRLSFDQTAKAIKAGNFSPNVLSAYEYWNGEPYGGKYESWNGEPYGGGTEIGGSGKFQTSAAQSVYDSTIGQMERGVTIDAVIVQANAAAMRKAGVPLEDIQKYAAAFGFAIQ